jgi:hypothetical protein
MNTYSKYCPNVFLAKCEEPHEKGEIIELSTKYGKENECIIVNLIYQRDGFYYYSIVRADGFNAQERAKLKAEKYQNWSSIAEKISDDFYKQSHRIVDNIPMGQPILVGHHSENRHRRDLDKSWNAMGKCVEYSDKAEAHDYKASYWAKKVETINLSMPECLEFYEYELEKAKQIHAGYKSGIIAKEHMYSMTYAKNKVNELQKNVEIAKKLWS